jgi:molecular chaperone GrpE
MAKNKKEPKVETKESADGPVEVEIKKTGRKTEDRQQDKSVEEAKAPEKEAEEKEPEIDLEALKEEHAEKIKELEDRYLRLAAEFDNYKKRTARQFEDIRRVAREEVLLSILDIVDNFERALEAANNSSDYDSLRKGMELIFQQLTGFLDREDIRPIPAVGETFDPNLHEAIMQTESEEYPEGAITQELMKGYKMGSRVLRFARVAVSRGVSEDKENENEASDEKESGEDSE